METPEFCPLVSSKHIPVVLIKDIPIKGEPTKLATVSPCTLCDPTYKQCIFQSCYHRERKEHIKEKEKK